jgi:hypothetical protein
MPIVVVAAAIAILPSYVLWMELTYSGAEHRIWVKTLFVSVFFIPAAFFFVLWVIGNFM